VNDHGTGISAAEAAKILGMHEFSIARLVRQGGLHKPRKHARDALDLAEVERVALKRYRPGGYWMKGGEVAETLGLCRSRIRQLAASGELSAVKCEGQWLYQVTSREVV
jgi:hypothetical protein